MGTVDKTEHVFRSVLSKRLWEKSSEAVCFFSTLAAVSTGLPFRSFLSFLLLFSFFVKIRSVLPNLFGPGPFIGDERRAGRLPASPVFASSEENEPSPAFGSPALDAVVRDCRKQNSF